MADGFSDESKVRFGMEGLSPREFEPALEEELVALDVRKIAMAIAGSLVIVLSIGITVFMMDKQETARAHAAAQSRLVSYGQMSTEELGQIAPASGVVIPMSAETKGALNIVLRKFADGLPGGKDYKSDR